MSDTQKPVEETPVAAAPEATNEAAPAEAPAATTEAPAAAEAEAPQETTEEAKSATAEETDAAKPEEAKETEKEEAKVTPATDGVLGYKAPGLVKGLRFSKKYFWFSDDAVEVKNLSSFFMNEKHSVSHPTGAWASQTGKGLLFFTKRAEDKATPTGIINLADVSDIVKDGANELHFKLNGQKHAFQANSAIERDGWVAALEAKSAEAKAEKESVVESEGYKAELEKMTKPPGVVAASAATKKSTDAKSPKEEKTEAEAAVPADKETTKDAAKETQKSRSQSRKRASIFGNFLAKKEEPEEKKEEKTEAKEEAAEGAAEAPVAESTEAAAESTEAKPDEKKDEKTEAKPEEKTTTKNKRASIFGNIFQKVGSPTAEKTEKEASPAVADKDKDTAVSSTAPQLGDPVDASASKPIEPESVTSPTEGDASKTAEAPTSPSSKSGLLSFMKKDGKKEAKTEAKPEEKTEEAATTEAAAASEPAQITPKDKRRTSMFGSLGTKKEKKAETSDGAESDSKAKTNKLGGLFRKPSKAVKPTEKKEEAAPAESEAIPEGAEKTENAEAANGVESTEDKKETIGDVSADSVNVGPSNTTTTTVQAAA